MKKKKKILILLIAAGLCIPGLARWIQGPSGQEKPVHVLIGADMEEKESLPEKEGPVPADQPEPVPVLSPTPFGFEDIPEYRGNVYEVINNDHPFFEDELCQFEESFERYSNLDELGRAQSALANLGIDLMPEQKRENISSIKPSGWNSVSYDQIAGGSLYNRCHLIGFQLAAGNANEKNLITGTEYFNKKGMLPHENKIAAFIKETQFHVLYRVTPVYEGDNLAASGVLMEACSVEDGGEGIRFNIFIYNVEPGIEIDYKTGESRLIDQKTENSRDPESEIREYVLNTNTMRFHLPECKAAGQMKEHNTQIVTDTRESIIEKGYTSCALCRP